MRVSATEPPAFYCPSFERFLQRSRTGDLGSLSDSDPEDSEPVTAIASQPTPFRQNSKAGDSEIVRQVVFKKSTAFTVGCSDYHVSLVAST